MHENHMEFPSNKAGGGKRRRKISSTIEKKLLEAELVVDKAEIKCGTLAKQWDKARSGDRRSEKAPFSLSRTRTGPRHGEGLQRNVADADSEYHTRVSIATTQRHDALNSPRTGSSAIHYMLLLRNGLSVGPVKPDDARPNGAQGMRDVINTINNDKDIENFVLHIANEVHPQPRNQD
ncbi:hypothetical protein HOY80DRAFT_1070690 [Tuber brumale]|nr:hypothetical protein HOY80DRAFT_1070690 [Tuber brumale]